MAGGKIIVPAKTMALLDKVASHDEEKVAVKLMDNQVLLSCANVVISSNLVEGNFPKYEDIIPSDYDKTLTLPTDSARSTWSTTIRAWSGEAPTLLLKPLP